MNLVIPWLSSFVLLIIIDTIWFSIMGAKFYKLHMSHIIYSFDYYIAAIFYFLYSFGIYYLVISPGLQLNHSLSNIAIKGFILGLVAYGAYNLTNHATIKNWPVMVTVVDMTWGASLTCIVSTLTYYIRLLVLSEA